MLFNNPISSEKASQIIRVLDLSGDNYVLDAGCGHGELLIRMIEASSAVGLGIDVDAESISAARQAEYRLGRVNFENAIFNLSRWKTILSTWRSAWARHTRLV